MDLKAPPASSRLERKKEETRRKIVGAALLLFQRQGYETTTMEQIAIEADVAKGTLYNYFAVKEAIVDEYIQEVSLQRNAERLLRLQDLPDTRSRMTLVLNELLDGLLALQELFEKYMIYRMKQLISFRQAKGVPGGFYRVATEIVRLGQESGELRCDLSPLLLEELFEFVFIELAKQFYTQSEDFNARQAVEAGVDLFINGARHA